MFEIKNEIHFKQCNSCHQFNDNVRTLCITYGNTGNSTCVMLCKNCRKKLVDTLTNYDKEVIDDE